MVYKTFAPDALPADAYVLVTFSQANISGLHAASAIYDLQAIDAATGELIETFNQAPVLTIAVGSGP